MEWKQQFEIFNKIISQRLSEQGLKSTIKNAAEYLGIPSHKYQAWKDGQRPVTEDLRMLAQEFEFRAEWLLLGIGEPIQPRLDHPFDPKYVEICDTLHELVLSLPDRLPKIAEVGGMTTTDLYDCIQTQAFPPSEAVAKWILHYRINANFLLAQIGKPYLTEEEYRESGPLDSVRRQRGDFLELEKWEEEEAEEEEEAAINEQNTQTEVSGLQQKLLSLYDELLAAKDKIIALQQENKRLVESVSAVVTPTETHRDNPQHATSDRPASGATDCGM